MSDMALEERPDPIRLFLAGDVMLGRGVDQIFPVSCPPTLHETYVDSAETYVELAEKAHGAVPRAVSPGYVWGDALAGIERVDPAARIANLETAVTTSESWKPKGINYRMHPANVACLAAAGVDCAVLANNHVLDWDEAGLVETLESLEGARIATAGAGRDADSAAAPAALDLPGDGRVLVFAFGFGDSGIPPDWTATPDRPGVHRLPDFSDRSVDEIADLVGCERRSGDVVVASIHWGDNWGYEIPAAHRRFARELVGRAGVDLVHGHSSHHPRAGEVHRERLILYGCGDFVNDYEGIGGHEAFRPDLVLAYFPEIDPTGRLVGLEMAPFRTRRLRLERPSTEELEWLRGRLDREYRRLGHAVTLDPREGVLLLD